MEAGELFYAVFCEQLANGAVMPGTPEWKEIKAWKYWLRVYEDCAELADKINALDESVDAMRSELGEAPNGN